MQKAQGGIDVEPRFWFNPELESRRFLVPGSISLIQMMIGALLTAPELIPEVRALAACHRLVHREPEARN